MYIYVYNFEEAIFEQPLYTEVVNVRNTLPWETQRSEDTNGSFSIRAAEASTQMGFLKV